MIEYIYVFNCPYHGYEHQMLCFRAYQEEYLSLWMKFDLVEVAMGQEDMSKIKLFLQEKR